MRENDQTLRDEPADLVLLRIAAARVAGYTYRELDHNNGGPALAKKARILGRLLLDNSEATAEEAYAAVEIAVTRLALKAKLESRQGVRA